MREYTSDIAFTDRVKEVQKRKGSRNTYAHMEQRGGWQNTVTKQLADFIAERDSFYMATVSSDGYPYIQHRGGPKGFLNVIDDRRADQLPEELPVSADGTLAPDDLLLAGGSAIIGPDGGLLAGPVPDEETLVMADCDLNAIARESMTLDVSGHYGRPDIFDLKIERRRP